MSKHWVSRGLVLGAGVLLWASGGCGSGGYMDRLDKRITQLKQASPFDEVLYDPVAVGETPVLVRVPKMCSHAWVEDAEEKRGDEKTAGDAKPAEPPKAVDPGRVRPLLDDRPADQPGGPPVREYVDLPGWTLVAYETLEAADSSKERIGCYWYFAVRKKSDIKAGERDLMVTIWGQVADEKYKDKSRKKQVQCADVQGKPVEWRERLRCRGPMRFYYEKEEGKPTANPFLRIDGTLELYLRDEGDYQVLFGWRAPTELAKKLDMAAIAEKVGGSVALGASGAAPKGKSPPPAPPAVVAKETPKEGEKPKSETGEATSKPELQPEPTDPNAQRELAMARMKRIGEALQGYVKKHGRFPPAIYAPEGQPHSWRVAILPFLGKPEEELSKQFRMNESWNSDFNKKLAEQMPEVFKTPGGPAAPSTCYEAVTWHRGVFGPPSSLAPGDVTDQLANTLVLVEVNADKAVPWNAPKDFELNEPQPTSGLGGFRGDKFLGLMGNGAVLPIGAQLDAPSFLALCTAAGGEKIDLTRLESGAPAVPTAPAEKPLLDLAKAAFAAGREADGLKFLMAEALVTGNEEVLGSFRRSTALKRGALLLRWAIIVETSRSTPKPTAEPGAVPPLVPAKPAEGEPKPEDVVRHWHDALVPAVRKALQAGVSEGQFGPWLKDVPVKEPKAGEPLQRWPGIVVLTETDGNKARDAALAEGLDLAVVVDVSAKRSGRGDQLLTVAELSVRDLAADGLLWGYDTKLNSRQTETKTKSGGNPIEAAATATKEAIDQTIRLEDFPDIQPAAALKRAEALVKQAADPSKPATAENRLPVLFELRFYAWKKLLTDEQLAGFYEKLLGNADEGKKLATGAAAERRAILGRWLPQTPAR